MIKIEITRGQSSHKVEDDSDLSFRQKIELIRVLIFEKHAAYTQKGNLEKKCSPELEQACSEYVINIDYPLNNTRIKLREAFRAGFQYAKENEKL